MASTSALDALNRVQSRPATPPPRRSTLAALDEVEKKPKSALDALDSVSNWHGPATPPTPKPQPEQDEGWLGAINRFGRGLFHPAPKTPEDWEAQNERERRVFMGTPEKPTLFTPETPERPATPSGYVRQAYQQGGALGAAGEVAKMAVTGPLYGAIKQRDTPLVQLGEAFDPGTEARGMGEAISHFGTPTNAAIISGASLLTGIPAAALSAYFATDMGIGSYQTAQEISKAKAEGREDDARELTGQLMVMLPAALGAAGHAGKKTVGIIGDRAGRIAPSQGPAIPPPPPTVDIPTGPATPRPRGPEVAGLKPAPIGAEPMDFTQAKKRLADVDMTLAEAGKRRLTQVQQEQLAIEKADLKRYLSREQMGLPFTDPNELRPAIPPSPVPEWQVPPGGRRPPAPYRSVLEAERAAAEGVAPSQPAVQSTLWGEHFPAVERVKEVTEALEGGSTAARKFIESLKPEEREAFMSAAKQIAEAEARTAETGTAEITERPQMLGADPGQAGQLTMPFGDLAASEVGAPRMGRLPIGPDLSARIAEAARLAERLREFEPHQQSVMWGSELTDFAPERPVYGPLPAVPPPPGGTATAQYPVQGGGKFQPGFDQPTTGVHRMDVETAKRTYPALKARADAIVKRDARLQRLQGRIYAERQKAGAAGYSPQKVAQLERDYRKIQSEGPSFAESPAILESVRQIEQQIGRENLVGPMGPSAPPPPAGGRGGPPEGPAGPGVPPPPGGAGGLPQSERWIRTRVDLEDRLYPVKAMEKMAREPLNIEASGYHRMRMYPAVFAKAQSHLETLRKGLKPIRRTLTEDIKGLLGKEKRDLVEPFERYATNAHELDVQQVYPERQFSGGRTREQVIAEQRQIQETLGPDKMQRINKAQRAYSEFGHKLLDELVDAGAFSGEVAARLKQVYPRYVPLERILAEAESVMEHPGTGGGRSMSVSKQDVVRKLTEQGSELEIQRALETMSRKAFDAYSLAERNRASRAVYDLAGKEEFAGTVIRLREGADPPPGMVRSSVLIDGVRHDYSVPRQVGEAIQGLTKTQADVVTEIAGKSAQALRAGATTWSLPFLPKNIARDYYTASMRSPVGFTPLDMIAGFYEGLKKGDLYHDYLRSGAAMSGFFEQFKTPQREARHLVESQSMRNMKKILNPFELFSEIGQAGENAARIGLYRRGKQAGLSEMEAGWLGRDTTVDFAKSGRVIRVLNILTPFLNARIQGNANMLRTFRDNPGDAALTWWALIGGPMAALYLWNTRNHPEAYRDMQPYTEENYYPLITGDEKDESGSYPGYRVPMDEFAQFGGRSLLAALQHLDENDPETLNKLADRMGIGTKELRPEQAKAAPSIGKTAFETAAGLLPVDITPGGDVGLIPALRGTASGILPPIVRGALEAGTGTSFFTGRPIGKLRSMEDLPEAEKYVRGETPDWLVSVGKWTNTSPERLKHIFESQFATVGRMATRGETPTGQVAKAFTGIPGGAVEGEGFRRTGELRGQAAMERMEVTAPAEQAFRELKGLPQDQKAEAFREKVSQLPMESRSILLDLIAKDAGGLTREEQSLKAQLVGIRAVRLLEKMKGLPEDQLQQNMERWIKGKLLTKETMQMMRQIQAAEAQGVEPKLRRPRR